MRRLKWASHVERMGDEKLAEIRCPEKARKTKNAMGGCVKRDLERVGGEWRTTAKHISWKQLIENIVRAK